MHTPVSRRSFVASMAATTTVLTQAIAADDKEKGQPRIVDTHVHLWDLKRLSLPWIEKDSPLARSYVMTDYQAATRGLNVVKGVYMEVDVSPKQLVTEAEYVLDICRQGKTPLVAAVIGGRPAADDFPKYLQRFRGNRYLKGVRQVLHNPATKPGFCLAESFVRGVRRLGDLGLCFDLCMRPADLGDAVKLVDACPDTRFVLDHCGNGPLYAKDNTQWRRDMDRLARFKNIVCKVSGIVAEARPKWTPEHLAPVINHTLRAFGPERVMFAGDWPVCTLRATFRQWLDALKAIVRERPVAEQRRLFHDNAVRFYGLA